MLLKTRGIILSNVKFGDKKVIRSEEHTSELQSRVDLVCRLLLEKKKNKKYSLQNKTKQINKTSSAKEKNTLIRRKYDPLTTRTRSGYATCIGENLEKYSEYAYRL